MQKQIVFRNNMFFFPLHAIRTSYLQIGYACQSRYYYTNLKTIAPAQKPPPEKKIDASETLFRDSRFEFQISYFRIPNEHSGLSYKWREWHVIVNWDFTKRMFFFYLCIFGKPNTHTCLDYRKKNIKLIAFIKKKGLIIKKKVNDLRNL